MKTRSLVFAASLLAVCVAAGIWGQALPGVGAYALSNASMTVNGTTCALGGSCTPPSGALVLVEQHTASNSASLVFTSCISSTYDDYQLELVNVIPVSDAQDLRFQFSTDGGANYDSTSGHYNGNRVYRQLDGNISGTDNTVTSAGYIAATSYGNGTTLGVSGSLRLYGPGNSGVYKAIVGQTVILAGGNAAFYLINQSGLYVQAVAVNAFQFIMSSGNISSGTIRCYGIAK